MSIAEKLQKRIDEMKRNLRLAGHMAAERIEETLIADATTKRGNVPATAPGAKGHPTGDVPIKVTFDGEEAKISAPDWVMRKAREKGQPAKWGAIIREEMADAMKANR